MYSPLLSVDGTQDGKEGARIGVLLCPVSGGNPGTELLESPNQHFPDYASGSFYIK